MKTKLIEILSSFIYTDITDMQSGIIFGIIGIITLAALVKITMIIEERNERKTARAK